MNKSIACILLIFSGIVQAQVNLDDARLLMDSGAVIVIDIRERNEHVTGVAKGMNLIPMSILDIQLTELLKDPKQSIFLICNTQNRSRKVVLDFQSRGYSNVQYVIGGMSEWTKRGWGLETPP
ncbi:PspE Rhodanese-related sulfurtransferase [Oxalobacteraceae bacterium]